MDNDTIVKIVLGSFGIVLLALNIIKDMVKAKNGKAPTDPKDRPVTHEEMKASLVIIKDNIDAVALLIKESGDGIVTMKDAENLLAINARDQHEGFFEKIPCYGRERCTKATRELFKDVEADQEKRYEHLSGQLANIVTMLNKLYGAKTRRHTEPVLAPHKR